MHQQNRTDIKHGTYFRDEHIFWSLKNDIFRNIWKFQPKIINSEKAAHPSYNTEDGVQEAPCYLASESPFPHVASFSQRNPGGLKFSASKNHRV